MAINAQQTGPGWLVNLVSNPPATATSPGIKGEYAMDASFLYICYANNNWKRITLDTF